MKITIKICFEDGRERMAERIDEIDEENFKVIFNDGHGVTETVDLTELGMQFLRSIDVAQMLYSYDTSTEEDISEEDYQDFAVWNAKRILGINDEPISDDMPF